MFTLKSYVKTEKKTYEQSLLKYAIIFMCVCVNPISLCMSTRQVFTLVTTMTSDYSSRSRLKWSIPVLEIGRYTIPELLLFLNFIPKLIKIYYIHLAFFPPFFLKAYPCFAFKKYTGTSKFPFRSLIYSTNILYVFKKKNFPSTLLHIPLRIQTTPHICNIQISSEFT
jgi:hypothetical protein